MFRYVYLCCFFFSLHSLSVSANSYSPHFHSSFKTQAITYKVATRPNDIMAQVLFDELSKKFDFKVNYIKYDTFSDAIA